MFKLNTEKLDMESENNYIDKKKKEEEFIMVVCYRCLILRRTKPDRPPTPQVGRSL